MGIGELLLASTLTPFISKGLFVASGVYMVGKWQKKQREDKENGQ